MFDKLLLDAYFELNKNYELITNDKITNNSLLEEDIEINKFLISKDYDELINYSKMSKKMVNIYINIKNRIIYTLLNTILNNFNLASINTFMNIENVKTKLYPYQINNVNWMINIENNNYLIDYENIKKN